MAADSFATGAGIIRCANKGGFSLNDYDQEALVDEVLGIIGDISYKPGSSFRVGPMNQSGAFIQHVQDAPDCNNPEAGSVEQRGRKHYVSSHACESEIVQTAFYAVKQFEEHECREWFEWKGYRIYGPHISIWALAGVSGKTESRDDK